MFFIDDELSKILGPLLANILAPPKILAVDFDDYYVPLFEVNKLVELGLEKIPIPLKTFSDLKRLANGFGAV